jgi:hypothetical protein
VLIRNQAGIPNLKIFIFEPLKWKILRIKILAGFRKKAKKTKPSIIKCLLGNIENCMSTLLDLEILEEGKCCIDVKILQVFAFIKKMKLKNWSTGVLIINVGVRLLSIRGAMYHFVFIAI